MKQIERFSIQYSALESRKSRIFAKSLYHSDVGEKIITLSTIYSHENFKQNNICDSNGIDSCKC